MTPTDAETATQPIHSESMVRASVLEKLAEVGDANDAIFNKVLETKGATSVPETYLPKGRVVEHINVSEVSNPLLILPVDK